MSSSRKRSVTVDLEKYNNLVRMMAWRTYVRLPVQTRMWIGIDDLIQHGMQFAFEMSLKFNRDWASFSTFLYHQLHRMFINEYLERESALKRGWVLIQEGDKVIATNKRFGRKRTIDHQSVEALTCSSDDSDSTWDSTGVFPPLVTSPDSIYQNALTECFVVPALSAVYKLSSGKLQTEFVNWFWYKKERVCTQGKPFRKLAGEFRELCQIQGISCNDCVHLIRSQSCLDSLSRQIFGVPWDFEEPCPASQRVL